MAESSTHASSSPCLFLFFNIFQGFPVTYPALIASFIAGVLPDVDTNKSVVGRAIPVVAIAKRLGISVNHQGFFHSVTVIIIAAVVLSPLIKFNHIDIYAAFLVSYFQHQILDGICSSTDKGIRWLAPFSNDPFLFSPNFSISYGSRQETYLRWILIAVTAVLLVVNVITPKKIFNYYFADVQAGIETINELGSNYGLKAKYKAVDMITKKKVFGVADVIGQDGNEIIMEKDGRLFSVSDKYTGDWKATKIRIVKGRPIKVESLKVDMAGKIIAQLHDHVQKGKRYRLFTEKVLLEESVAQEKQVGFYNPVSISGKSLRLNYATIGDLRPYEHLTVEKGTVLIRYELDPGETITFIEPKSSTKLIKLELDEMSELGVKEGDRLCAGCVVATVQKHLKELNIKRAERENLLSKIAAEENQLKKDMEYFQSEETILNHRIARNRKEVKIFRELVEEGNALHPEVMAKEKKLRLSLRDKQKLLNQKGLKLESHLQSIRSSRLKTDKLDKDIKELRTKAHVYSDADGSVRRIQSIRTDKGWDVTIILNVSKEQRDAQRF